MTRLRIGVAWAAVAGMATTAVLPWLKPGGGKVAAMTRSLMPWSGLTAVPVAVGAVIGGRRPLAAASGVVGADVLTFSELTPTHCRRLHGTSLSAAYPHQIELSTSFASGAGLWSRWPLTSHDWSSTNHRTIVADVHA